jgi:hypothetical protein
MNLGDRVRLRSRAERKAYSAMNHGIVVAFRGKHDPKNPRVRWDSGWGVTSEAKSLRLLTPTELMQYPLPPRLVENFDQLKL